MVEREIHAAAVAEAQRAAERNAAKTLSMRAGRARVRFSATSTQICAHAAKQSRCHAGAQRDVCAGPGRRALARADACARRRRRRRRRSGGAALAAQLKRCRYSHSGEALRQCSVQGARVGPAFAGKRGASSRLRLSGSHASASPVRCAARRRAARRGARALRRVALRRRSSAPRSRHACACARSARAALAPRAARARGLHHRRRVAGGSDGHHSEPHRGHRRVRSRKPRTSVAQLPRHCVSPLRPR